jgi:hypothetical protein
VGSLTFVGTSSVVIAIETRVELIHCRRPIGLSCINIILAGHTGQWSNLEKSREMLDVSDDEIATAQNKRL